MSPILTRDAERPFPLADDPVGLARSLAPRVRALAAEAESTATVPAELVRAFYEGGLYSLLIPTELGGGTGHGEATPAEVLGVLEELAAADGSTAWALMATMAGMGANYAAIPDEGIQLVLASGNPITAGEAAPTGVARRVDGGYIVSGRWRYASGSSAAGWFHAGFTVVNDEGEPVRDEHGARTVISGLTPSSDVELCGDWDVLGLVATTSVDYAITNHFLPDALVRSRRILRGDTLHRAGVRSMTCMAHTGVALGLMRGALDEFAEFARAKVRPPSGLLARQEGQQSDFAKWRAAYRSARGFALDALDSLRDTVAAGATATPTQQADVRLSATYAIYQAADVTRDIYLASGGDGLRNGRDNRIQRFFRDAHAASQHMLTDARHVYVETGRIYLDPPGIPGTFMRPLDAVFMPPIVWPADA